MKTHTFFIFQQCLVPSLRIITQVMAYFRVPLDARSIYRTVGSSANKDVRGKDRVHDKAEGRKPGSGRTFEPDTSKMLKIIIMT
jgi:hypothetical protein